MRVLWWFQYCWNTVKVYIISHQDTSIELDYITILGIYHFNLSNSEHVQCSILEIRFHLFNLLTLQSLRVFHNIIPKFHVARKIGQTQLINLNVYPGQFLLQSSTYNFSITIFEILLKEPNIVSNSFHILANQSYVVEYHKLT